MRSRSLLALALAAAFANPVSAAGSLTPSQTSAVASILVVTAPFMLSYVASDALGQVSANTLASHKRWRVAAVRPEGDMTALELRSLDDKLKLETKIATATARSQGVKVDDELAIETVGKSGYTLRKGETTIAVLAPAGNGLIHSKVRG